MTKKLWLSICAALMVSGCSSIDLMAPIEDRSSEFVPRFENTEPASTAESVALGTESAAPSVHLQKEREAEESGRIHVVAAGDTLYNIGVRYGVNPRAIQQLNGISNPSGLSIGQEIKIPTADEVKESVSSDEGVSLAVPAAAAPAVVETKPADVAGATVEVAKRPETADEAAARKIQEQERLRAAAESGNMALVWPARGDIIATFKETKAGIDIAGVEGDPVVAVLDGTVHYVGNNNVPGYGNFVIIRHNFSLKGKTKRSSLMTVYANASKILVRKGESVRQGQIIAEMGNSDSQRVKLRFELRQDGKGIDPIQYLEK